MILGWSTGPNQNHSQILFHNKCPPQDFKKRTLGPRVVFEAILKNGAKTARQFETPYFDLFHAKNLIDVKKIEILRIHLFASGLWSFQMRWKIIKGFGKTMTKYLIIFGYIFPLQKHKQLQITFNLSQASLQNFMRILIVWKYF